MKILAALVALVPSMMFADGSAEFLLSPFRAYLEWGTYEGNAWAVRPKSRYDTFKAAFERISSSGAVVVELGTTRSFVHGGHPGCNLDDTSFWTPDQPENWDWGAGFFTRMAAICLHHLSPTIHTVDLISSHIERCKVITSDFSDIITYHVSSSERFLSRYDASKKIDLLYLDTGDMTPIEPTAELHLREAKIIVERDLIAEDGLILIDDVKNTTPKKFGETSNLGKAKYSLPYFLSHGFEIVMDEYQVLLRRS